MTFLLHCTCRQLCYSLLRFWLCLMRLTFSWDGTVHKIHSYIACKMKSMSVSRYLNYIFLILHMMYIVKSFKVPCEIEGGQKLVGWAGHFYFYLLYIVKDSLFNNVSFIDDIAKIIEIYSFLFARTAQTRYIAWLNDVYQSCRLSINHTCVIIILDS